MCSVIKWLRLTRAPEPRQGRTSQSNGGLACIIHETPVVPILDKKKTVLPLPGARSMRLSRRCGERTGQGLRLSSIIPRRSARRSTRRTRSNRSTTAFAGSSQTRALSRTTRQSSNRYGSACGKPRRSGSDPYATGRPPSTSSSYSTGTVSLLNNNPAYTV